MVRPRFFDIKLSFSAVAVYWCYIYYSGIRVNVGANSKIDYHLLLGSRPLVPNYCKSAMN